MKTALLIVVESHPPNRTARRGVVAGKKIGSGTCRIMVSANFLEDEEVSRVDHIVEVPPERTGT